MNNEANDQDMDKLDNFDIGSVRITSQFMLFLTHTVALIIKRGRVFKRDIRSLCCEILLPCVVVLVGLGLMSIQFVSNAPTIALNADLYPHQPLKAFWAA